MQIYTDEKQHADWKNHQALLQFMVHEVRGRGRQREARAGNDSLVMVTNAYTDHELMSTIEGLNQFSEPIKSDPSLLHHCQIQHSVSFEENIFEVGLTIKNNQLYTCIYMCVCVCVCYVCICICVCMRLRQETARA